MNKEQILELIKLLSSLESWCFTEGRRLPDYLQDRLGDAIGILSEEVLK